MKKPAIWFPAVQTNTGTDIFTKNLARELNGHGIRTEINWLPPHAEYLPWSIMMPQPPEWANIVHVNSWFPFRLLPSGIPIITTVHHTIHRPDFRKYKSFSQALYHRYWIAPNERNVLRKSSKVVAVSKHVAKATQEDLLNIPLDVIYNGVDVDRFTPNTKPSRAKFQLLFAGSWNSRKGIDLLAPIMKKLGPQFELLYTGPEGHRSEPNMVNIGHTDHDKLLAFIQNADALLFPTRSEGLGLIVLEALACGTPVISTNIPPITELITHKMNGYLCDIDDVCQFTNAIVELSGSEMQQNNMRLQARNSAIYYYSSKIMTSKYIKAYSDTL